MLMMTMMYDTHLRGYSLQHRERIECILEKRNALTLESTRSAEFHNNNSIISYSTFVIILY